MTLVNNVHTFPPKPKLYIASSWSWQKLMLPTGEPASACSVQVTEAVECTGLAGRQWMEYWLLESMILVHYNLYSMIILQMPIAWI